MSVVTAPARRGRPSTGARERILDAATEVLKSDGYAGLTMLLLVVLLSPGPLRWLLGTAPMRFVGERSYSLYLLQGPVHFVVIQAVPGLATNRTVTALTVFLVGLAIADLIHRWVEKPLIDIGKNVIARKELRRAERREASLPVGARVEAATAS